MCSREIAHVRCDESSVHCESFHNGSRLDVGLGVSAKPLWHLCKRGPVRSSVSLNPR